MATYSKKGKLMGRPPKQTPTAQKKLMVDIKLLAQAEELLPQVGEKNFQGWVLKLIEREVANLQNQKSQH